MAGASRFPFLTGAVNMRRSAGSVPAQARSARPPVGARCSPWTLLTLARHGLARRPADNHRRAPGTAVWRVSARPHSLVLRRTACVMVMPLPGLAWLTRPHAAARTPRPSDAFHLQCSWISHPRAARHRARAPSHPRSGPSPCACAASPRPRSQTDAPWPSAGSRGAFLGGRGGGWEAGACSCHGEPRNSQRGCPAHRGPPGEQSSGCRRGERGRCCAAPTCPRTVQSQASGAGHSPGREAGQCRPGVPLRPPLPLLVRTDSQGEPAPHPLQE